MWTRPPMGATAVLGLAMQPKMLLGIVTVGRLATILFPSQGWAIPRLAAPSPLKSSTRVDGEEHASWRGFDQRLQISEFGWIVGDQMIEEEDWESKSSARRMVPMSVRGEAT